MESPYEVDLKIIKRIYDEVKGQEPPRVIDHKKVVSTLRPMIRSCMRPYIEKDDTEKRVELRDNSSLGELLELMSEIFHLHVDGIDQKYGSLLVSDIYFSSKVYLEKYESKAKSFYEILEQLNRKITYGDIDKEKLLTYLSRRDNYIKLVELKYVMPLKDLKKVEKERILKEYPEFNKVIEKYYEVQFKIQDVFVDIIKNYPELSEAYAEEVKDLRDFKINYDRSQIAIDIFNEYIDNSSCIRKDKETNNKYHRARKAWKKQEEALQVCGNDVIELNEFKLKHYMCEEILVKKCRAERILDEWQNRCFS